MDYTTDIFARLQKGEKIEDIAKQLTDDLNKAHEQYQDAAKQEEAKRQAMANKSQAMKDVIAAFVKFLEQCGVDESLLNIMRDVSDDEVEQLIQEAENELKACNTLANAFASLTISPGAKATKSVDPIEDFLNRFVRKP